MKHARPFSHQRERGLSTVLRSRDIAPTFVIRVYFFVLFSGLIVLEMQVPYLTTNAYGTEEEATRLAYPIFLLMMGLTMPLALFLIRFSLTRALPWVSLAIYAIYGVWCLGTALWSPMPLETAVHALVLLLMIALAVAGAVVGLDKTIGVLLIVSVVVMALSWIVLPLFPEYALRFPEILRLRGIMMHEFRLGYLSATAFIVCIAQYFVEKGQRAAPSIFLGIVGVFSLVTLLATQTRSLTVYTMMTVGIMCFVWGSFLTRFFIGVIVFIGSVVVFMFSAQIIGFLGRGEQDFTLTGRTLTWERTMVLAEPYWLIGAGFKSYYHPMFDYVFVGEYRPAHAHNAFLNAYFETGVIGVVLLLLLNVAIVVEGWRIQRILGRPSIALHLMILAVIAGMTGIVFGSSLTTLMGVCLVFFVQEAREAYGPGRGRGGVAKVEAPRRLGDRWLGARVVARG